jgi:enoyl-CoA hydratase
VLTGAGDTFSAGGDVKAMAARHGTQEGFEYTLNVPAQTRRMLFGLLDVPQPIIAAINGDAVGLGATIALFADVSVMAEDAKLGDTHVRVGLVAGDGSTVMWPLLIGPSRAKELLMRARLIDGAEALRLGLVNHVAPRAEVMEMALGFAEELTRMPVRAVQWTKQSVNQWIRHQLNLLLDGAIAFEMLSMNTYDHGEAARAFAEKRRPKFEDR